jgi:hypothetical protein
VTGAIAGFGFRFFFAGAFCFASAFALFFAFSDCTGTTCEAMIATANIAANGY